MAIAINHPFVSGKTDGTDATLVQPSNWNATLSTSMATNKILGRMTAGTGAFEELSVTGTGNVVLSASPTFTGTVTTSVLSASSTVNGGVLSTFSNGGTAGPTQVIRSLLPNAASDTTNFHFIGNTAGADKVFIYANGNVANANNSYGAISDRGLKRDISEAGQVLDSFKGVSFYRYHLLEDGPSDPLRLGVIAQEMETSGFANLVSTSVIDGKKRKTFDYSNFAIVVAKALQEVATKVEALETARLHETVSP